MKLGYALEIATANELGMRDAYFQLWKKAAIEDPDLAGLWEGMAEAEGRHAEILGRIKESLSVADLETVIELSVAPLDEFARRVDEFRDRMKTEELSRDDIFRFAIEMEAGEQNGVLKDLLAACPTPLADQIEDELVGTSHNHLRGLLSAIEGLSLDEELRQQIRALRAQA